MTAGRSSPGQGGQGAGRRLAASPASRNQGSQPTGADQDLPAQLRELKAKAAALKAAFMKRHPGAGSNDVSGSKGMSAMGSGGMGMGMMGWVG